MEETEITNKVISNPETNFEQNGTKQDDHLFPTKNDDCGFREILLADQGAKNVDQGAANVDQGFESIDQNIESVNHVSQMDNVDQSAINDEQSANNVQKDISKTAVDKLLVNIDQNTNKVDPGTENGQGTDSEQSIEVVDQNTDKVVHFKNNTDQGVKSFDQGTYNNDRIIEIVIQGTKNIIQNTDDVDESTETVDQSTDNIEQRTDNVDMKTDNVDLKTDNVDQSTDNVDQSTDDVDQSITDHVDHKPENVDDSLSDLNYSRLPASLRKRLRWEIDIELKDECYDDDDFYDNGQRKYRLREKITKKIDQTPITNIEPVKKVIKKKIKCDNKPQSKAKSVKRKKYEAYDCEKCQTNYTTKLGLLNHMGRRHPILKFTCSRCSSVFNSNTLLIEHKSAHKDEDFLCTKCEETFIDHSEFLLHELKHQKASFYKCPECPKMFINKKTMSLHIHSHFGSLDKCEICLHSCRADLMEEHLNTHSKIKTCVECGKTCKTKTELAYHMVSHTGLKTFQCFYCGKGFATASQRDIHMRTHTKEKPYECSICFSSYSIQSTLKKHLITHQTEPQYKCEICFKKYFHKRSYEQHLSVHSNTQKYTCNLCKTPLSTYHGLKNHMLYKHSKERNVHCVICDLWFKNKQALKQHCTKKCHLRKVYEARIKKETL